MKSENILLPTYKAILHAALFLDELAVLTDQSSPSPAPLASPGLEAKLRRLLTNLLNNS